MHLRTESAGGKCMYITGALRVAQSAAFLMLQYSQQIRTSDAATSAKLFNYAQFQASLMFHRPISICLPHP
jgi:hypothetical protein